MQFWQVISIIEEFENGGQGRSVQVLDRPFAFFDAAAAALASADPPFVAGRVIEANAYVVEADDLQTVQALASTVLMQGGSSPRVRLVLRDILTQRMPEEMPSGVPAEIEALDQLHGELCISHQLTELALSRVQHQEHRARLARHRAALEEFGFALRIMRGEVLPDDAAHRSGSERLGYSNGHIDGGELATFHGSLQALAAELSIARHQAKLTEQATDASAVRKRLHAYSAGLDGFIQTVTQIQEQVER